MNATFRFRQTAACTPSTTAAFAACSCVNESGSGCWQNRFEGSGVRTSALPLSGVFRILLLHSALCV